MGLADLEIDIVLLNNRVLLPRLPCSVVYDLEISRSRDILIAGTSTLECRRCGLHFRVLPKDKQQRLLFLIEDVSSVYQEIWP
jgi:hypothetical protein